MEIDEKASKDNEINIIDIIVTLLRHKKMIIEGTLALAVLMFCMCFIVSYVYTANTTIIPPQQSSGSSSSQLLGQMAGTASMMLGISLPSSSGDLFAGLVKDNSILDRVIDKFDLMTLYDLDTRVDARKLLAETLMQAEVDSKSGIVSISVDDTDPKRAAEMANTFADELKKVLETLAITEASVRRVYFEGELKKALDELVKAETALMVFQQNTGALKLDDQTQAVLQGIAAVKAQIAAKKVQLQVMSTYATLNNPDLKKAGEELRALTDQLRLLEAKEGITDPNPSSIIPTGQLPTVGTEYIRRMRDFKYNEALFQLVFQQYEAAKLDESRQAVLVQVIQKAIPPDKKSKPKLVILVALSIVGGAGLLALGALGKDLLEKAAERPENEDRFYELKYHMTKL